MGQQQPPSVSQPQQPGLPRGMMNASQQQQIGAHLKKPQQIGTSNLG